MDSVWLSGSMCEALGLVLGTKKKKKINAPFHHYLHCPFCAMPRIALEFNAFPMPCIGETGCFAI